MEQLNERLKNLCPEQMKITILPTKTRRKINLIVLNDPYHQTDLDDWAIFEIYPLYKKIFNMLDETDITSQFRLFFRCEEKIVFYSPRNVVFQHMNNRPYGEWYGEYQTSHFVGIHNDPQQVIDFLTQTEHLLF